MQNQSLFHSKQIVFFIIPCFKKVKITIRVPIVFCVRHNQRRRDNGDQRSDRIRPRYDVLGERAARGALPRHDDEVFSLFTF